MECAESRKRKREEYEMQLFDFHSRAVYATLKNIVMERIQSKSRKLFETLETTYKLDNEKLALIKTNEEQLVKAYYAASVPHLQNIEDIVNRFITIPSHVLLNEDKLQQTQYTETEFGRIHKKLGDIQQRAKRATILNAALKEELQLIEQFPITNNTDKLSHIIENSHAFPDINNKIDQLVKIYEEFSLSLNDGALVSRKFLYNTIDKPTYIINRDMDNL